MANKLVLCFVEISIKFLIIILQFAKTITANLLWILLIWIEDG